MSKKVFCFLNILISFLLISICFSEEQRLTTNDPGFIEKYKIKFRAKGVDSIFPKMEHGIVLHYICRVKQTGEEIENTYRRNTPKNFQINNFKVIKCLQNVLNRMCLGEKLFFECPINESYFSFKDLEGNDIVGQEGRRGVPEYLPEEEELIFEVELQAISDMRTFKTLAFS